MKRTVLSLLLTLAAGPLAAQGSPSDPVLAAIWREGMEESRLYPLAQALLDSIGPRLTGTPQQRAAHEWAAAKYREWGIDARIEPYGTWTGWRRGVTHVDLLEPRVRTLEATMLGWSPGTDGPVSGGTVALPDVSSAAEFRAWLPQARGKWVLTGFAHPTCRPEENWERWATPESLERMRRERAVAAREYLRRLEATGLDDRELPRALEEAGALGIFSSDWQGAWGTVRIFDAHTRRVPMIDLSCEDYGLLFRLTENGQAPVVRVDAEAEFLGEVPTFNTLAVIPGTELPDEYVLLSAHFDSWDGASGATDNGSGTVTMMEAMRILKEVYPNPRRTIMVGHWGGEEQGLNGSLAFAEDNPAVVDGLQIVLNQDNGTGRVVLVTMQGFAHLGESFRRWLDRVPESISDQIRLDPGIPSAGGSDYASFVCRGVPAVQLSAHPWDYSLYTWHSNRDTFDKLVFDDLRNNATLTAMLAYLASEDPDRVSRERRTDLVHPQTGQPVAWPTCRTPMRSSAAGGR